MSGQLCLLGYSHLLASGSETESDDNPEKKKDGQSSLSKGKSTSAKRKKLVLADKAKVADREVLLEQATKYQKCMKKWVVPEARLNETVIVNWQSLVKTLRRMYGQPMHYLTIKQCKEWDKSRLGSEDEGKPFESIMKLKDAEETLWHVERVHRRCTSPIYLAMLWRSDPEYLAYVNEVVP
ncbi:hypothetical protein RIF29_14051 [Crotalaria pallida]|uniref:Uncharacterized protein n=1 Tax=Crotalaria pallida TaxID=3830 RepID=A0AAN9FCQ4_CROPI